MDAELFLETNVNSGIRLAAAPRFQLRQSFTVLHADTSNRKLGLRLPRLTIAAASPDISYNLLCKFRELASTKEVLGERNYKYYTARDVALGLIDVFGWMVEADGKGEVGKVAEIIHVGRSGDGEDASITPYEYLLKVVRPFSIGEGSGHGSLTLGASDHFDNNFGTSEVKILIPIINEFVQLVDPVNKRLLVDPPDGLLELAARPELIAKLQPEIQLFCKRYVNFLAERFIGKKNVRFRGNTDNCNLVYAYMPTREQMFAVGRTDLVRRIKDAGGFLYVANALGLRSSRRPNGFWDNLQRLDFEIECFLLESWVGWVQLGNKETGEVYFHNPVTNEVVSKKPAANVKPPGIRNGKSLPLGMDVGNSTKIMPRMKIVAKAGRWDLHHAIVWNGGYREVARQLGRRMIRNLKKTRRKRCGWG